MQVDLEANWNICRCCSFHCTYCSAHAEFEDDFVASLSVREIGAFFDGTKRTWLLHLTGGEPFLYPGFVDLCCALTNRHYCSLNTNLTSNLVDEFIRRVDPLRIAYLHCSLHETERFKHNMLDDFTIKVRLLRAAGFKLFITQVMTPNNFKTFKVLDQRLRGVGIVAIPKVMRGIWSGLEYPFAYTADERKAFIEISKSAEEAQPEFSSIAFGNRPTIDPFLDREYIIRGLPNNLGRLCRAGFSFVRIHSDGMITRCGRGNQIGHLKSHTLNLFEGPKPCEDQCCPYYCNKYIQLDEVFAEHSYDK